MWYPIKIQIRFLKKIFKTASEVHMENQARIYEKERDVGRGRLLMFKIYKSTVIKTVVIICE